MEVEYDLVEEKQCKVVKRITGLNNCLLVPPKNAGADGWHTPPPTPPSTPPPSPPPAGRGMGPTSVVAGGGGGGGAAAAAAAAATAGATTVGATAGTTTAALEQTEEELQYRRHCDAAFRLDLCRLILLKSHYPKLMKMDMQLGAPPPRAIERGFAPTSASLDTYLGVKRSHLPHDRVVPLNTNCMPTPPQADDGAARAAAPVVPATSGSRPNSPPLAAAASAAGGQPQRRSGNGSRSPSPPPIGGGGRFAALAAPLDEKDEKA
jgi:hypothetical protein